MKCVTSAPSSLLFLIFVLQTRFKGIKQAELVELGQRLQLVCGVLNRLRKLKIWQKVSYSAHV